MRPADWAWALTVCLALVLLCSAQSLADDAQIDSAEAGSPGLGGWIPSLSLGFGVQVQDLEGSSAATFADFSAGGEANDILTGDFRGRLEMASPALLDEDGLAPRIFVHSGFQVPFSDDFVADRLNLSFGTADPEFATNCSTLPPNPDILSCDTSSRSTLKVNAYWQAGIGFDFIIPVDQRQFRIRPSLDYVGQSVDVEGVATRTLRGASNVDLPGGNRIGASSDDKIIHGLGPRIQIDVEVAKNDEFTVSLFVESGFYWMLSDRSLRFSSTDATGESATFKVKLDDFAPQGGAGIRIAWTRVGSR